MRNKLPKNWCECKLEDILEYEQPTKYIVENTEYSSRGTPVLTAGKSFILGYTNEKDGIFYGNVEPVIIFDDFTTASKLVNFPFKVKSSAMKILHAVQESNINFIYYLMQTIHYNSETHKRYWISEYSKQIINIPPLPEQERIVEKIEELFSEIDEGIKNLKTAQLQLKQYRQSVLKSAFEGKLYKATITNNMVRDIGTVITGSTPPTSHKEYYGHAYPFYKPSDLNAGYHTNKAFSYVSVKGFEISRKLPEKSILVTCIGATIGKTALIRETGICNQQINAIIPSEKYCPEFIYFYAISKEFQEKIKEKASATTLPILNKKNFEKLPFKYCSLPEQERIVEEIEKRFEVADEMERAIKESLEDAQKLKQSILKKAFSGQLVPQNPDDEPASALLEHIKAKLKK